jgi:hypothetical protein
MRKPAWDSSVRELEGQKVAAYCFEQEYRGLLREVYKDHLILSPATWVKIPGWCFSEEKPEEYSFSEEKPEEYSFSGEKPEEEYPIENGMVLNRGVIDHIYQPKWSQAPLPDPLEDALPRRGVKGKEYSLADTMQQFQGLRFVVIGTTFSFRGILRDVHQDHIILEDVTVGGSRAADTRSNYEVHLRTKIIMNIEAVAGFYQPRYLTRWGDE